MLRAIIFDLDGTLLDRDTSLLDFIYKQYERVTAFHHVDVQDYAERFIALDQRGYVWKDKVYQTLIEEFKANITWEELLQDYTEKFQYHCKGFPHLVEMLDFLRAQGMKLAIITNGYEEFQANNIRALGIEDYFDVIMISEREGLRKPDPEIFRRTLELLGVTAEDSIYVGDHPINDVVASRKVGMQAIWKKDLYYEQPSEANWVIDHLLEIRKIVSEVH
ncbi:L-2-haloalkanoic acid dehalogenase [Paenibacillus selenitireducens]|uniref:L-2-haloalkanoic acid dehalogenase n=1 Tax=Paenibacillus selenitireducens TaxID=1324314 RepID=A0A1T2XMX1_9BACL|nr:HAD family hydrolase [Paenibacillus selenitireducens]OPA81220.1 L-2-haloalkanoic acid dehalogenase [Paenibacillus selenitireducens]